MTEGIAWTGAALSRECVVECDEASAIRGAPCIEIAGSSIHEVSGEAVSVAVSVSRATVGAGTNQRRLMDHRREALDWALAIERSRPHPGVTTMARRSDHAALLRRFAELADRARFATPSPASREPNFSRPGASSRCAHCRSAFPAKPSRSRAISGANEWITPSVSGRRCYELWTDVGDLGTCDARHVCGISVASRCRVWLDLAGNNDRYAAVAQRFRECVVECN